MRFRGSCDYKCNKIILSQIYLVKDRKLRFEASADKLRNLIITPWFLLTKLIAWKCQYLQACIKPQDIVQKTINNILKKKKKVMMSSQTSLNACMMGKIELVITEGIFDFLIFNRLA